MIDPKSLKMGEGAASSAKKNLAEIQQMIELCESGLMSRTDFFQQVYGMSKEEAEAYREEVDADRRRQRRFPHETVS